MRHGIIFSGGGTSMQQMVDLACQAEQAGVDSIYLTEAWRSGFVGLAAIAAATERVEIGPYILNAYARSVSRDGNRAAQDLIRVVFMVSPRRWRGIGEIPHSGLEVRPRYAEHDAKRRFDLPALDSEEPSECIGGLIMQGAKKPMDCPLFGHQCTPEHPVGAPMVSSEGACAAYHRHRRFFAAEALP